ncbi:MAG TPA: D-alanine--D-alanine ligase family protein [Bacteroidota bacterium]|nr:D-alanine--D-alanine ligase family protein [Bacteroidota bacterium]
MTSRRKGGTGKRLRVGVVFGGRSVEHEVSVVSAISVMAALDRRRFEVIPIGITPDGKWLGGPGVVRFLQSRAAGARLPETVLLPDPTARELSGKRGRGARRPDVIFPVLHGSYGEDGTIQGLFELAGIPYVGAGVIGSAVGMDKIITKLIWKEAGLPVLPSVALAHREYASGRKRVLSAAARSLGFPCFVKPANSGSSIGISKARDADELRRAADLAFRYDTRIMIEKGIDRAREIEVAVLGNDVPETSVPGEIVPSNEFYDYDAKYVDGKSATHIPADLPSRVLRTIRSVAGRAYSAIGCEGMARVDFLLHPRTLRIWLSEANTIPGFTSISMYPKLWEASGLPYGRLLERLIALALERHARKGELLTSYTPKKHWYR